MYGALTIEEAERRAYANGNVRLARVLSLVEDAIVAGDDRSYDEAKKNGYHDGYRDGQREAFEA